MNNIASFALLAGLCCVALEAAEPVTIDVWPGKPPDETKTLPPEENLAPPTAKRPAGKRSVRLTNISIPTLAFYRPDPAKNTGTAIIVCPGGAHRFLSYDFEGTDVAEWLQSIGVTGIVLKYRVPARDENRRWLAAVQDAQRAVGLVRSRAAEWNIAPDRVGLLGFSAGGEAAGWCSVLHRERQYAPVDEVDRVSCRPDFTCLIYGGGFIDPDKLDRLRSDFHVDQQTPPMFLVHAYDDKLPVLNALLVCAALKQAGVPAELHIYSTGGHGFGMRRAGKPINDWPRRCEEWLRVQGIIK